MDKKIKIVVPGLILLVIALGITVKFTSGVTMSSRILRMAYNYHTSINALDPAEIRTSYEYGLVRNLYGRLVDIDLSGNIVTDVPESFSVSEKSIEFKFSDKVKTINNHPITARDAELSLKRLIMRKRSGHGDIRRLLCPNHDLIALNDDCPGIKSNGNTLTLTVENEYYLPMLISVLESADYSIIPEKSLKSESGQILIRNYSETSGPYYIEKDSNDGSLVLKANPNHYHYSKNMPQEIQLVPTDLLEGLTLFKESKVDLLPTSQSYNGQEVAEIMKATTNEIHETLPLKVRLVAFTPLALKDFTPEQRMFAALKAGQAIAKLLPQYGSKPTAQFFQALSDGALTSNQLKMIEAFRNSPLRPHFNKPIELELSQKFVESFRNELAPYPEIRVIETKKPSSQNSKTEFASMYFISSDSAWSEDFNLISYNFQSGTFELPGMDKDKWLTNYLSNQNKELRIQMLNELQYKLLSNASFVPLSVSPYYAVVKKPWTLNQSKLSAGTKLWEMRRP